jgi:hypothetical protein
VVVGLAVAAAALHETHAARKTPLSMQLSEKPAFPAGLPSGLLKAKNPGS